MAPYDSLISMNTIVVEADPLLSDAMLQLFQGRGCPVQVVSTAERALQALATDHFDVIISDHSLPGLDGVTFLMRSRQSLPDALRILLTNYPTSAHSAAHGPNQTCIDAVIAKPFTVTELENSLCRVLETAGRNRSIS